MKNKLIILAAILGLTISCQDAYEIEQPGYRTEESQIFNTPADIERGVNALYNYIPAESEINFVSYFTDELGVGRDNAGQGINDGSYRFFMNSGTGFAGSLWNNLYGMINRANRLINRIDYLIDTVNPKADDSASQVQSLKVSKARLKILRAFAHMKLFAYYTPDYSNKAGLSVIKFDFLQTDDYTRYEKRSTVSEIVSFIEKDISEALADTSNGADLNMKVTVTGDSGLPQSIDDNNFISKNVAHAILVKLYAMTGNSNGIITNFNDISGKNIGDPESYTFMFDKDESGLPTNPDIIWRLVRWPNDGGGVAGAWWAGRVDPNRGSAYMEIGRSLYNEIATLNSLMQADARYGVVVHGDSKPQNNYQNLPAAEYKAKDLLFIGKYKGTDQAALQNDIQLMRYTDLYLTKAEALAMNGDFKGVEDIIKDVRTARTVAGDVEFPVITNVKEAWNAILKERRVEFAFEGTRYLDMKRIGVKAGSPGFVRDAKDCETNNACSLEASSYKLTLPIPRSEMLSNPNMVQNPGY